ncbi:hypothetical protein [Paludisphaera borealis]|uniref:Uncharacterized protein n=1 Tax=Paludisphaera borealis TaxID=1387353 RepID=A0A1U7CP85_9BACT|nr:hypothetical protein [Paludisphaera borealis]APW60750.1 hypothetical protein BSF38_02239 [Paludisphaera borealis]
MRTFVGIVLSFVVLGGPLRESLAQDPNKPDPSPSLNAIDAKDLRGLLNGVLDRIAINPGADAVFPSQTALGAFIADAQQVVARSSRGVGRSVTTKTLGDNVLATIDQIAVAAQASGVAKISASNMALLTGRTSLLLSSVVFDGERVFPAPQAPSKSAPGTSMPPVPSKSIPGVGAAALGPVIPSAPSKVFPPQAPTNGVPPSF